jgi:hypothetical protein
MKRYLVVLVIVLVAGAWVAGFAPEYSARHEAEGARDQLQQRLDVADVRLRIGELLGQSLALGDLARDARFGEAQPLSSAFFDAVRAEAQRATDPAFRESLEDVLESRDPVTSALSLGKPEASERIAGIQRRLRRSLGYTVPGGAPPSDVATPEASREPEPEASPGATPTAPGATPDPDAPPATPTPPPETTPLPTASPIPS